MVTGMLALISQLVIISVNSFAQLNTGQTNGPAGFDLNVEPAWMQGVTGRGVVVSFVDDGNQ